MKGKEGFEDWRKIRINSQGSRLLGKFRHGPKNPHCPDPEDLLARALFLWTAGARYCMKRMAVSQCRHYSVSFGASCLGSNPGSAPY